MTFALGLLLSTLALPAQAQPPSPAPPPSAEAAAPTKLVVGTMRVPPFVNRGDDGQWSGLSIDLWHQIAKELNVGFEFREYDYDLAGLLSAVERGQVDVAIAAIPVSVDGESRFDFSHPYFAAGLGIAVRAEPQMGMLAGLGSRLNSQLFIAVAGLFGMLLIVGTVMWLVERRHNAQHFDPHPVQGISDGLWWAAVTMTTTGYGDKVPASWRGRAVGLIWMFTSIFLVALFSATMASSFVVTRLKTGISSPADLQRARVAAVTGTAGEQWLTTQGMQARTYPFVIQASKALQRGDVEALIYERAIIGHMIKHYGWRGVQMLPHTLAVRDYAIALPVASPIKEPINRALLKVVQDPEWQTTVQRYVGSTDPKSGS